MKCKHILQWDMEAYRQGTGWQECGSEAFVCALMKVHAKTKNSHIVASWLYCTKCGFRIGYIENENTNSVLGFEYWQENETSGICKPVEYFIIPII